MENENAKAVYKLHFDCGKQGSLEGLFTAKKEHVKWLLESGTEVYFGEVLGKHSEVMGPIEEGDITLVSDDLNVIKVIEENGLQNGYDPFDYSVEGCERDEFNGMELSEVMVILDKEKQI